MGRRVRQRERERERGECVRRAIMSFLLPGIKKEQGSLQPKHFPPKEERK
jgi:hypothetical protein